ncbi:ATP-binding protein, partial [Myxococcota bacterium]|nr:ATP-binding protein [Myxococcota bacterium]
EAALRYALERGGRSGRVARQFANEWIGRIRLGAR